MQKNFIAFIVCSFLIMVGWSSLMSWLRPTGVLLIRAEKEIKLEGVKLKISAAGQKSPSAIDLGARRTATLAPGKYQLKLEHAPKTLRLAADRIEIVKGTKTTVVLIQSKAKGQVARADNPKANKPNKKPEGDDPAGKAAGIEKPGIEEPNAKKPDDEKPDDEKASVAKEPAAADLPAIAAAEKKVPLRRLTLGSLQADSASGKSGYRMLVTLISRGAAVERIELNKSDFLDLEDRSGYLGHLAVVDDRQGVRVSVVGPGTPAAIAGLKGPVWQAGGDGLLHEKTPGDVITQFGNESLTTLGKSKSASDKFHALLAATSPGETVRLTILRGGKTVTVSVTLVRRPLEVVRPEIENSILRKDSKVRGANDALSFLLTLDQVGKQRLHEEDVELDGVHLRSGNWQVLDREDPTEPVVFYQRLEKLGLEIRKIYRLDKNATWGKNGKVPAPAPYHLSMSIEIKNIGKKQVNLAYQLDGPTGMPTEGSWYAYSGLRDYIVWREAEGKGEILRVACRGIAKANLEGEDPDGMVRVNESPLRYIGVDTQYFASVLLPHDQNLFRKSMPIVAGKPYKKKLNITNVSSRLVTHSLKLAPGRQIKHDYDIFAGPKLKEVIAIYGLEETVDYGMFWFVAEPMQKVLHFFHDIVGNFGVAIIMLTVMVRLCMFPLSRKQVLGAQKMQELQPEMKRINEKYKKNMEARNKATQTLFRKHNYNPLSGCVLIFFQFPIFIGLYRSLQLDVELRQAPLIPGIRWCSNLAAPDMLADWSSWAPDFIQHGIGGFMALGPYFNLLPIFTVALFVLQQKMFTPPPTSDQAEMQQKIMKYMMLVIGLMFYKVASGLCLYFIASSLWGLGERKLLPKTKPKDPSAETAASPLTPKSKSKSSSNGAAGGAARRKKKQKRR